MSHIRHISRNVFKKKLEKIFERESNHLNFLNVKVVVKAKEIGGFLWKTRKPMTKVAFLKKKSSPTSYSQTCFVVQFWEDSVNVTRVFYSSRNFYHQCLKSSFRTTLAGVCKELKKWKHYFGISLTTKFEQFYNFTMKFMFLLTLFYTHSILIIFKNSIFF